MDKGTLMGFATVLAMLGFLGVCFWAYSGKRKQAFDEAANIPFADDGDISKHSQRKKQ